MSMELMKLFYKNESLRIMKSLAFVLILCLVTLSGFAQNKKALEKIESARIALITERLELTPAQAEKFWPLYREYNMQRKQLRQEFRQMRQELDLKELSDEKSEEFMQKRLEWKQTELNLEKKYAERLSEVISSKQLLRLRSAEEEFQRRLLERIQQQRQRQLQNQQRMQRQQMMQERNNN
jgi:hypothetical protein